MKLPCLALSGLAIAVLLPTPAVARVVDARATGMSLENVVTVPVDAETAWDGLVRHVDRWWPKDHSWFGPAGTFKIEAKAGGCFCETAGRRQAEHMRIGFVDPRRLLRMVGGLGPLQGMGLSGALDWKFEPVEGGTRITLSYVVGGYAPTDLSTLAPIVDQVQGLQLEGLRAYLTGGSKPAAR